MATELCKSLALSLDGISHSTDDLSAHGLGNSGYESRVEQVSEVKALVSKGKRRFVP